MRRRKYSKLFKYILNTATVASVLTVIACVFALEANKGSWLPIWVSLIAVALFIAAEWMKERESE